MGESHHTDHGALVGWTVENLGSKLALRIQSVDRPPPHEAGDIHTFLYVMDKNQAVQLGNYLFQVCGQTAPARKRTWLDRLLGA